MRAAAASSIGDYGAQMSAEWPVVGRDDELGIARAAVYRGQGVVIVGAPGIGKTMLLGELRRQLARTGRDVHLAVATAAARFPLPQAERLSAGSAGERSVLLIDDAHLLDDHSAARVWQLAATRTVVVLATVRTGEPLRPDVDRLWTSDACERLDLTPLTEAHVRTLLETVLGGDVEDRAARLLHMRTGGNALLIRELLRSGMNCGVWVRRHEVWSLAGELPLGAGTRDLVQAALAGVDRVQMRAAELVAAGEPVSLAAGRALVAADVLESLEAAGIVVLRDTVDGSVLTMGHPLYGEVIRDAMPILRIRRLRCELADLIASVGYASDRDRVRCALWRLEAQVTVSPTELLEAARLARALNPDAAAQLAEAAIEAGAPAEARILLASWLTMRGDTAGAQRWLDTIASDELTETQHGEVWSVRAFLSTQTGQLSAAAGMISRLAAQSAESVRQLEAIVAQALVFDGHLLEGVRQATIVFDTCPAETPRAIAAMAVVAGAHFRGDGPLAERVCRQAGPLLEATRGRLPYGLGTVTVARAIGLAYAGDLDHAEATARALYARGLAEDDDWLSPRGASGLGVVALTRGQVRTATRYFRIAVASLNLFDRLFLRYNLAFLVRGATLCGSMEEAERALRSGEGAPVFRIFEFDVDLARAALLAGRGYSSEAAEPALQTARAAAEIGAWTTAAVGAHEALRYAGSAAAADLVVRSAGHAVGPMFLALSEDAAARVDRDGHGLDAASARFETLGVNLLAAESAYAAAAAHRCAGDSRSCAASSARGIRLHARCQGARIPWALPAGAGVLTVRENQVAVLAAAGRTDAQIAAELGIASRTVSTHLSNVYGKLKVPSRRGLFRVL